MFIVLSLCLLYYLIMVINDKTYIEIKYTKNLTKCFESKCKQDKTRKVPNIRHKY